MKILDPERLLDKQAIADLLGLAKRSLHTDKVMHKVLLEYGMFDMNAYLPKPGKHACWRMMVSDFNIMVAALKNNCVRIPTKELKKNRKLSDSEIDYELMLLELDQEKRAMLESNPNRDG
jgi:hypothetical protein